MAGTKSEQQSTEVKKFVVFDTTTLWSCDSALRLGGEPVGYSDRRGQRALFDFLVAVCNPDVSTTYIVPDPKSSTEIGKAPLIFDACVKEGVIIPPTKEQAWSAQTPKVDSDANENRFNAFVSYGKSSPQSLAAFIQLHAHPDVGDGWLERVEWEGKEKYKGRTWISDLSRPGQFDRTIETKIGIPLSLTQFLADPKRQLQLSELAATIKDDSAAQRKLGLETPVAPEAWDLRLGFSIVNRGADYGESVNTVGQGRAKFITHAHRHFLRSLYRDESASKANDDGDSGFAETAAHCVMEVLKKRFDQKNWSAEEFAKGCACLRGSDMAALRERYKELVGDYPNLASLLHTGSGDRTNKGSGYLRDILIYICKCFSVTHREDHLNAAVALMAKPLVIALHEFANLKFPGLVVSIGEMAPVLFELEKAFGEKGVIFVAKHFFAATTTLGLRRRVRFADFLSPIPLSDFGCPTCGADVDQFGCKNRRLCDSPFLGTVFSLEG